MSDARRFDHVGSPYDVLCDLHRGSAIVMNVQCIDGTITMECQPEQNHETVPPMRELPAVACRSSAK
jgi:hypothetical protein